MEDVASISASPIYHLTPADSVGGLLAKPNPELGLAAYRQSHTSLYQVGLQRVIKSEVRSPAATSSALWNKREQLT